MNKSEEQDFLISSLMAQKAEYARLLLKEHRLPMYGNKAELRDRILEGIQDKTIPIDACIRMLDKVDAWGRQHVFMYKLPGRVPSHLKTKSGLQGTIDNHNLKLILNESAAVKIPTQRTFKLVELTEEKLRIEWVEKREWFEKRHDLDKVEDIEGDTIWFEATQKNIQRAVSSFEYDFVNELGTIFIHRLPKDRNNYANEETSIKAFLQPFLDLENVSKFSLSKAIARLKDRKKEARERKSKWSDAAGAEVAFKSSGRTIGLNSDSSLKEMRELAGKSRDMRIYLLNCFWPVNEHLDFEVHTYLDALEHRVAFLQQSPEKSVRHVLSRIRALSQ